ncbi:MAG TPA: ribonuclease R, partial [Holosporales bacterium]|nr:ribonuclease R [Holosporales bacterium]
SKASLKKTISKTSKKNIKKIPSESEVVDYVQSQNGFVLRRDIARAFQIKGPDRRRLKEVLMALVAQHTLERRGKSYRVKGEADLTVIEVLGVNEDGNFIGCVIEEDHHNFEESVHLILPTPALEKQLHNGDRWAAKLHITDDHLEATLLRRFVVEPKGILGLLQQDGDRILLAPLERKDRDLYLVDPSSCDRFSANVGDLVEASLEKVPRERFKAAHVLKVLSPKQDLVHHLSHMAIHRYDLETEFSKEALAQAQQSKLPSSLEGREDLRDIPLVTIDDKSARDHDDAVYAEPDQDPNNKGGWRLLVAIADVSHFVTSESALDQEAQKRGNSTYFPDQVVPMLPERLSNDLCSLRPHEDRPCLAVWMRISKTGKLLSKKFIRGLMRSHGKLTYVGVQAYYDGKKDHGFPETLDTKVIDNLYGAYDVLKAARKKRGTLELEVPEQKITLAEDGSIKHIQATARHESNLLIEEFMVLANVAAAEFISDKQRPCLFRVHDSPKPERVEELRLFLESNNLKVSMAKGNIVTPLNFNHILDQVRDVPICPAIHQLVLRSQARANYSPDNLGHFGLNLARYAHFTSPIRRYADLTIHRAIVSLIESDSTFYPYKIEDLTRIGQEISDRERTSTKAERETVDRYIATYLENRAGETFPATVSGMTDFAIFLTLDETGSDGILPLRNLGGDYFQFDPKAHSVVGRRSRAKLTLGDAIEVRLEFSNPVSGSLLFSAQLGREKKSANYTKKSSKFSKGRKSPAEKTGRSSDRSPSRSAAPKSVKRKAAPKKAAARPSKR